MAGAGTLTRDQELWGYAFAVAREHSETALLFAAMEIDWFDFEGAHEAAGVWRKVLKRLETLAARSAQRQQKGRDEQSNDGWRWRRSGEDARRQR